MRAKRHRPQEDTWGPDQGFCEAKSRGQGVRARWQIMIQDFYRSQISPGEINMSPSLTEPARIYSIGELLARPDLILSSRSGYSEDSYDPADRSSWDRLDDPQDIPDNFDFEVPRDPDLYNPPRHAKPRPRKPKGTKNVPGTDEHRSSKDPKDPGERRPREVLASQVNEDDKRSAEDE